MACCQPQKNVTGRLLVVDGVCRDSVTAMVNSLRKQLQLSVFSPLTTSYIPNQTTPVHILYPDLLARTEAMVDSVADLAFEGQVVLLRLDGMEGEVRQFALKAAQQACNSNDVPFFSMILYPDLKELITNAEPSDRLELIQHYIDRFWGTLLEEPKTSASAHVTRNEFAYLISLLPTPLSPPEAWTLASAFGLNYSDHVTMVPKDIWDIIYVGKFPHRAAYQLILQSNSHKNFPHEMFIDGSALGTLDVHGVSFNLTGIIIPSQLGNILKKGQFYQSDEVLMAKRHVKADSVVLDLGGGLVLGPYVNKLLSNPNHHHIVELSPDRCTILERLKLVNGCQYTIHKSSILPIPSSGLEVITVDGLNEKNGIKFDTLLMSNYNGRDSNVLEVCADQFDDFKTLIVSIHNWMRGIVTPPCKEPEVDSYVYSSLSKRGWSLVDQLDYVFVFQKQPRNL
eukprot:NODE_2498_length_1566_cov_75.709633_g2093_i1.p1 GENE.NODE_2498_length_1566_cov_75.709633_g2093_i1~~NODE_2498_length_1566_cov_75.709633_g2093_i1.p1  ORF type:complete len:453 (-),score=60.59 NODE_2498_length_1566_cov_75.709633_g2093_i1:121-1479(-)